MILLYLLAFGWLMAFAEYLNSRVVEDCDICEE